MALEKPHYKDPGITHGHFRVLPRTDGLWAVIDEREPPGYQTVMTFKKLEQAAVSAEAWFKQGH